MYTRYVGFQFNIYSGHRSAAPSDFSNHIVICELILAYDTNGFVEKHIRITSVPMLFQSIQVDELGEVIWPLSWEAALDIAQWWWPLAGLAIVIIIRGFIFSVWVSDATKCFVIIYHSSDVTASWQELIMFGKGKDSGVLSSLFEFAFVMSMSWVWWCAYKFTVETVDSSNRLLRYPDRFNDLMQLRSYWRACLSSCGLFGFVIILKLLKFIRVTSSMDILWRTLAIAITDLLSFFVTLVILVLSFAFLSVWIFGYRMPKYHNVNSAGIQWMLTAVGEGDYDYAETLEASVFAGPLFLLFVLFVCIFAMNVFIAILSEAYEMAKEQERRWKHQRNIIRAESKNIRGLWNEPIAPLTGAFKLWWQLFLKGELPVTLHKGYDDPEVPSLPNK